MELENYYKMYKEEVELIDTQNRIECDLCSIIAYIIREGEQGDKISLRDISVRRKSDFSRGFIGEKGPADFVIREREKSNEAKVLGAIEVKYINEDLGKYLDQLNSHIDKYKKVIYTNGLIWRFYEEKGKFAWEVKLGTMKNGAIIWSNNNKEWKILIKKLDNINWREA